MSKEPDKTEDSDKIRQLAHGDGKISETLSLDTEEVGIPDSTSKPKLSQENYPQKVDTSELKLEKNKTSVDETEKSKNEFDCKKCREGLKDFEGMTAHDSFHIENKKSSLHISKVFDHLQKKENSKLITQTSDNENISVSSTSKISSPSCKISEHDSLQLLPLAKSKQIYTPSINTLGGYSSRSPTSSVESQKLQSRRSFPLTKTMRSEVKKPKRVSNKNLMYVKPPRLIMPKPSKELKDDSDPDDSASRDLSESYRTSCIANTNRPPDIEVPNRVFSNYPVDVTPPRRVINHMPVNLFQSPQMYNTQTISAFAGNIVIPAPLNLDQSPRIYNTETLTSSGTVIIPAPVNILQSRAVYITHVPSDSSGGVMSPTPVNLFQTPEIKEPTTRTVSTQTESEKCDSPKSLTIASLKPVSSLLKKNKNNLKSGIDTTISDISPTEKFGLTKRERFDNYPTFVTPKKSSPTSDDFLMGDKFRRLARKSFPRTTSSGKVTSLGKKFKNTCLSSDERIRGSSLKTFSQDSIDSKDLGELSRSQSPMGSSISVDKLTLETKSGKSKALSFTTPKPLSPSFRACIKDSSGGFVNPETKDASKSSQIPNISDENKSTKKKERAKESYAKSVTFSAPKKRSPNRSKDNTPGKVKKLKNRPL